MPRRCYAQKANEAHKPPHYLFVRETSSTFTYLWLVLTQKAFREVQGLAKTPGLFLKLASFFHVASGLFGRAGEFGHGRIAIPHQEPKFMTPDSKYFRLLIDKYSTI